MACKASKSWEWEHYFSFNQLRDKLYRKRCSRNGAQLITEAHFFPGTASGPIWRIKDRITCEKSFSVCHLSLSSCCKVVDGLGAEYHPYLIMSHPRALKDRKAPSVEMHHPPYLSCFQSSFPFRCGIMA